MSNNAFYGFDEEEEKPVKNNTSAGGSTGTKKKKKKKKSKKTGDKNKKTVVGSAGIINNPAFVLKQKLLKQGYQSAEIDKCLDIMFTSGEQYDDYESVKAKLDGKSQNIIPNTNTNIGTTNHEQVRAASKNKNNNSNSNDNKNNNRSTSDSNNNGSNGWESVSKKKSSNNNDNNNSIDNDRDSNSNNTAEPTIADRLEAATKMKPCSTVMEVLTRWCMQYPDDLIELFRCKAASQLFENYLTDRYLPSKQSSSNDVGLMLKLLTCIFKEKLSNLIISNLKSFISALKDLSLDNDEWRLVVKRYSNLLSSRLSEFMQYGDQVESIPQDLKKLQDHLQANIVAADEFGNDNGDENIANSFRRRDLACERVVLGNLIRKNTARLAKAVGSSVSNSSRDKNNASKAMLLQEEKNDARILESLGMSVQRINESNQKGEEAKEVQKQLNKLRAESKRKIEPLEKEEKQTNDALRKLEEKKQQLLKDLESVQGELDILYGSKSSVAARKAEINMEMESKLTKLDNEHKGMAVHLRRAESQSKIAKDFRRFDEELVKQSQDGNAGAKIIQDRLANALRNAGGANAVNKRSKEVLRTALSYTRMELNCLSLMRNRVKSNKEKIVKTREEVVSMKALGLTNVVSQLERTEKQIAQYIEQDEGVVGALSNKAVEIFNIVKAIGDDHAKDIDSLDGLTSDLLQKLKKGFIELDINSIPARNWNPPKIEGVEDNGSNSMFSSNLAASLGIAPTKSSSSSTTNAPTPSSAAATKPISNKTNKNNVKKEKKTSSSGSASAGPAKKMGWGAIPKQQKAGKSLLELQAEELEGRLTEENLRRLEIGKSPAKSPLLDRLKEQIEGGQ